MLLALFLLNALDLALTTHLVYGGFATEINPLLAWALERGFVAFVLAKFACLGIGLSALAFVPAAFSVRILRAAVVLYSAVVLYQLYFFFLHAPWAL